MFLSTKQAFFYTISINTPSFCMYGTCDCVMCWNKKSIWRILYNKISLMIKNCFTYFQPELFYPSKLRIIKNYFFHIMIRFSLRNDKQTILIFWDRNYGIKCYLCSFFFEIRWICVRRDHIWIFCLQLATENIDFLSTMG